MPSDGRRPRRIAEAVRGYLAEELIGGLGDARLAGAVVTRVEVSPDLGYAEIQVRLMTDSDEKTRQKVLGALARASGHLRRGLGPRLGLKRVPELRFHYDTGPDARARVDELLEEWRREQNEG
jgi:ribosome-binding factor A